MTADEVLTFARNLPPTITRVEIPGVLVIEQAAPPVVRAAPEIGDVGKAARAKAAERPPSDVESLGHTPPKWED